MSSFRYGDILWLDFTPSAGHEQVKRRPAVVVSNDGCNMHSNLVMVVPVTSAGSYPLHVNIGEVPTESGRTIEGWAEVEQLKSLDLEARHAVKTSELPDDRLDAVTDLVLGCLMKPTMKIEDVF